MTNHLKRLHLYSSVSGKIRNAIYPVALAIVLLFTICPAYGRIAGNLNICAGDTVVLTDTAAGGNWSSSSTGIAAIDVASGIVTGVAAGTAVISYTIGGRTDTAKITVHALPLAISGTPEVCTGATRALSDAGGGAWSVNNTAIATIGSTGIVTGKAAGTVIITYKLSTGCITKDTLAVDPAPSAIVGPLSMCIGLTAALSDTTDVGVWASSNTSVATVDGMGTVTSVALGSANITYTISNGCRSVKTVTVHALPSAISGTPEVCTGATRALSDAGGGAWSISNTAIATIAVTGVITGKTVGTAIVTYKLSTGCITTDTLTVDPSPSAIVGALSMCIGLTAALSDTTDVGVWASSNTSVATVDGMGTVTSVALGSANITYTISNGCRSVKAVTVHALPSAISGTPEACTGATRALSDAGGGAWSISNTAIATIAVTGVITGKTVGTAIVTYKLSTGCITTDTLTVDPSPSAIVGALSMCIGLTAALSDTTDVGVWASSNTSIATVDGSGAVTSAALGTANITYTISNGCRSVKTVTVHALPSAISGTPEVCTGATRALSDAGGGAWSVSNTAIATIGITGVITGKTTGTAIVTYKLSTGCTTTDTLAVDPSPSAVLGALSICSGLTTALSDTTDVGAWASSNISVAMVDSAGITTGVGLGTASITYTASNGCWAVKAVTVHALPSAISGMPEVCTGAARALSDAGGGAWSVSNTTIATIGSTGIVTGKAAGTTMVTYKLSTGCIATDTLIVDATPSAITGASGICNGLTAMESDIDVGGAWSSSNTSVAVIDSTGTITALTTGTAAITYTFVTGCGAKKTVTVNVSPAGITGAGSVCPGSAATLSDVGGGVWGISNTAIATIGLTGIVTGKTAGTAIVTYKLVTGCLATDTIMVNPLPSPIVGALSICTGLATALSDTTGTGAWSSSNTSVAVTDTTGAVTGIAAGTANVTYTISTGCSAVKTVTVHLSPSAIAGAPVACTGATAALSDAGGGAWSISNTAIATIGLTGIVTGKATGTAIVTYKLSTGCMAADTLTVNASPSAILGSLNTCSGLTTVLNDTTGTGAWSSGNTSVAVTDSVGTVTGMVAGVANITYTAGNGCIAFKTVTVHALPSAISGAPAVCVGSATALSDAGGGIWSSSNTATATVGLTGIVTGKTSGTAIITYKLSTGCLAADTLLVNATPAAIAGASGICNGLTAILSDASPGGAWSSSNSAIATIDSIGTLASVSAGTTLVTYAFVTGCQAVKTVTVNALPSAITGIPVVCASATTALSDAGGGVWSSSNTIIATVGVTGIVTGKAASTATITYKLGTGCIAADTITVIVAPAAITGSSSICMGVITTLADVDAGGAWSSSDSTVAAISGVGDVTPVALGTATITYTDGGTGCTTQKAVTVNTLPASITGPASICAVSTIMFSDSIAGGVWTSSNTLIATIDPVNGIVASGVSGGTTGIGYRLGTGCIATVALTVNALPSAIAGPSNICLGAAIALSYATGGGTWISGNPGIIAIDSVTGIITGITTGSSKITYALGTGCGDATKWVLVNPLPASITGTDSVCTGSTITLRDVGTGKWTSDNPSVATVAVGTGVVTGISSGTANISFILSTGCKAGSQVTVNQAPSVITGPAGICKGASIVLSDAVPGAAWSSSNTTVATVDSAGIVTGMSAGAINITYGFSTGCKAVKAVTVHVLPTAIAGKDSLCQGFAITLSDGVNGGLWSSGNTAVATIGATSRLVSGISSGTAIITYTLSSGCMAVKTVTVNNCGSGKQGSTDNLAVGDENIPAVATLQAYPNPSNGAFTLMLSSGKDEPAKLTITNVVGQKVMELPMDTNKPVLVTIQSQLPAGLYFITVETAQEKYVEKMIIGQRSN